LSEQHDVGVQGDPAAIKGRADPFLHNRWHVDGRSDILV